MNIEIEDRGTVTFLKINGEIIRRGIKSRMNEYKTKLKNGEITLNNEGKISFEDIIYGGF